MISVEHAREIRAIMEAQAAAIAYGAFALLTLLAMRIAECIF